MSGVKSLHRNMKTEDTHYDSDLQIHQRELWGADSVNSSQPKPGEEMDVMAARDVIVNYPGQPAPQQPVSQPPPQTPPSGMSPLQVAMMAGSLAAGAGGLGYALAPKPAVPVPVVQDANQYDLGLLPPVAKEQ